MPCECGNKNVKTYRKNPSWWVRCSTSNKIRFVIKVHWKLFQKYFFLFYELTGNSCKGNSGGLGSRIKCSGFKIRHYRICVLREKNPERSIEKICIFFCALDFFPENTLGYDPKKWHIFLFSIAYFLLY